MSPLATPKSLGGLEAATLTLQLLAAQAQLWLLKAGLQCDSRVIALPWGDGHLFTPDKAPPTGQRNNCIQVPLGEPMAL